MANEIGLPRPTLHRILKQLMRWGFVDRLPSPEPKPSPPVPFHRDSRFDDRQQFSQVIGFGAGRNYAFAQFLDDAADAGFAPELQLSTWDLRPFTKDSDFLVAVLRPA